MAEENDSRARVTRLVIGIQDNVLRWAQEEGQADGIAACTELLTAFCQAGTTRFPTKFQALSDVFEVAAASLYAVRIKKFQAIEDAAVKFREAVKSVSDVATHARAEYRALDEVLNGSTPESETTPAGVAPLTPVAVAASGAEAASKDE